VNHAMTLPQVLNTMVAKYPAHWAIVCEHKRFTYGQLKEEVLRTSAALIAAGVRPGDRVAIWISNRPEYLIVQISAAYIGAVTVPLNTRYTPTEVSEILRQSEARALFMMDGFLKINYLDHLQQLIPGIEEIRPGYIHDTDLPDLRLVVVLKTMEDSSLPAGVIQWDNFLNLGDPTENQFIEKIAECVSPSHILIILFTSGTTGKPKGAILEHQQVLSSAYKHLKNWGLSPGDSLLIPNPFSHIMGLMFGCLLPMVAGSSSICIETFEVAKVLSFIEQYGVAGMSGTPAMYMMMLNDTSFDQYNLQSLRVGIIGGAASSPELIRNIKERLGFKALIGGLGMTEAAGSVSSTRISDPIEKVAYTVGKPVEGIEAKVVDVTTKQEVSIGEKGELAIRGSSIMRGYYKQPDQTAKVLDENGWFYTGDLVSLDQDGYLRFEGRQKEMFTVGGFNVYPKEVENTLKQHPDVIEAEVVGVPDDRLGDVAMAFLRGNKNKMISDQEILDFCRRHLANYKVPRYIQWVDSFPMTSTGKISKVNLELKAREILKAKGIS
jgi:fatty-acyl-CoA synthase